MRLLHLGCADDIRPGFDNRDPAINGWRFQDGLRDCPDGSVDGITISHAMSQLGIEDWPDALREFYRVLRAGGVVRITDDDTESIHSPRHKTPWPGVKSLTGPVMATAFLRSAGFRTKICRATETYFGDPALLIAHREHKVPRYVFYIEGIKYAS